MSSVVGTPTIITRKDRQQVRELLTIYAELAIEMIANDHEPMSDGAEQLLEQLYANTGKGGTHEFTIVRPRIR